MCLESLPLNQETFANLSRKSGILLLAMYFIAVLFDVFPPKLLQPDWIVSFAASLTNYVSAPVIGIVLLHLSSYLEPGNKKALQMFVTRLALCLALLFFLIQPLMIFAIWKNFVNLRLYNKTQSSQIRSKANELNRAAQSAATFEELQRSMIALQGPQIPDNARSLTLPVLKKQLRDVFNSAEANFSNRLVSPTSPAYQQFYKRVVRTWLISVLAMLCFGLLAWDPLKSQNVFVGYLKSFNLFGVSPGSLRRSFLQKYNAFQDQRKKSADLAAMRDGSVQRERKLRKLKAQQEREQKRNMAERRKQEQRMERVRARADKQSQNKRKNS